MFANKVKGISRLTHVCRALHYNAAFAFDIDGVLLRTKTPIPGASEALKLLQKEKIPFILLTNGGGTLEEQRAAFISDTLGVPLSPLQIIQSHTPFKQLVPKYEKVLAVGSATVREVAETYGFKNVVHPIDIMRYDRSIAPFSSISTEKLETVSRELPDLATRPFDAVLVFNDSRDWGADIQIVLDVLNSEDGYLNTVRRTHSSKPSVPIYFSNNDLLWANQYSLNRIGQGAFRSTIGTLYSRLNDGHMLEDVGIGKPTKLTYDFAHHVLIDWQKKLDEGNTREKKPGPLPQLGVSPASSPFDKVFMVGDNPASDIIGAHGYGWNSCLVRTGVYQDGDKLPCKPTLIADNVLDAIEAVLEGK
ncbi:LAMI_0E12574g1_1 [Lachancea mirantina]|uniref:LAMI_0E12574g1_1 n=1 Tax=Lachancea mirantina TaxID=1230905 RepID=A0A1G4JQD2_9SACH|nr:LAMI_0E12574g1_1 [Lachancea mirantina]